MIADIGRTACTLSAPNGDVYAFFNAEIENKSTINYYEKVISRARYRIEFSEVEKKKKYRALHYARYLPNGILETSPRLVPFVDYDAAGDATQVISPLYEVITPTLGNLPGRPGFNLIFWTNLSEKTNTLKKDSLGVYEYDSSKILRFENDQLEEVDLDNYSIKLLCSAQITWERLKTVGGVVNDSKALVTPIIRQVFILMVQEGNIAIDFSGGGTGGGMRRHNHADNNNAGFAYAVFAPGTSLQPINWK